MFSLDMLLGIGFLAIAFRYSSLWLGGAMILQSLALLVHGARLSYEGVDTYTWMVLNNLISLAMLVCIMTASFLSSRSRRKPKPPTFQFVADPA